MGVGMGGWENVQLQFVSKRTLLEPAEKEDQIEFPGIWAYRRADGLKREAGQWRGRWVGRRSILGAEAAGLSHWLDLNMEGKKRAKMTPTFLAGASAWMKGPFTEMEKAGGGTD